MILRPRLPAIPSPAIADRLARASAWFETELRKSPKLAVMVDKVRAAWSGLIDSFCDVIEPILARFSGDLRLVATQTSAGKIVLHKVTRDGAVELGPLATCDPSVAQAKWHAVELRLRPDQVLQRSLTLPSASRGFLDPIIEHKLEGLTPWHQSKVMYGYSLDAATGDEVRVVLTATSRDIVQKPLAQLVEAGLSPTAIGPGIETIESPLAVNVLKGGAGAGSGLGVRRIVSRAALVTLACLSAVCLVTSLVASSAEDAEHQASASLIKARRLLRAATVTDIGSRERSLLDAKDESQSVLVLLDRLSTEIPANTYLKELSVTADKVRLVGSSMKAPDLIAKIEGAGLFDVRFSSAVTRDSNQRDSFEITANRKTKAQVRDEGAAQ